jgi:predicted nucleotidyltransferase
MTDLINLTRPDLQLIKDLVRKNFSDHGYELYVFGSRSKNTPCKPYSDLDLILKLDGPIPRKSLFKIEEELELSTLNYQVDILDWHRVSDVFKQTIKKDLKILDSLQLKSAEV